MRGCAGRSSTWAGGPCSTTTPPSRKTTSSATSRAKPISAGQVPDHRQDLADELGVQRRGRLVEEDHTGPQGQRPGDRDPLLLAPGELARVGAGLVGQPDAGEQLVGQCEGVGPAGGPGRDRRGGDVVAHRHVREQVEVLEHEPDATALVQDRPLRQLLEPVAVAVHADRLATHAHVAAVELLQVVDGAQQRRLAGAGRAEDHRDRAGPHGQVDAAQDLVQPERLVGAVHLDGDRRGGGRRHRRPPSAARSRGSGVGGRVRRAPRAKRRST